MDTPAIVRRNHLPLAVGGYRCLLRREEDSARFSGTPPYMYYLFQRITFLSRKQSGPGPFGIRPDTVIILDAHGG